MWVVRPAAACRLKEAADAGNSNAVNTLSALDQARKIYKSSAVQQK